MTTDSHKMGVLFKDNKYTKWYMNIVERAKNRVVDGYTESHHIIPRCLGGSDDKNNLVSLTAREHFICHLLLTKMSDNNSLKYALQMMTVKNKHHGERHTPNSLLYEYTKTCNSIATSERLRGKVGYNAGRKKYRNLETGEVRLLKETPDLELWEKFGGSEEFKALASSRSKGRVYYHCKETGEARGFKKGDVIPSGWVKGNPRADTSKFNNIKGSSYYHNPENGDIGRFQKGSQPIGWVKGSCEKWINNGTDCKKLNVISECMPDGWVLGRIRKEVPKWRKPKPIETPLGIFNNPLDFCEKYFVGQSIFDNLDSKIRKRKSNKYLREELESVGYDFSKTKSENGFYWK